MSLFWELTQLWARVEFLAREMLSYITNQSFQHSKEQEVDVIPHLRGVTTAFYNLWHHVREPRWYFKSRNHRETCLPAINLIRTDFWQMSRCSVCKFTGVKAKLPGIEIVIVSLHSVHSRKALMTSSIVGVSIPATIHPRLTRKIGTFYLGAQVGRPQRGYYTTTLRHTVKFYRLVDARRGKKLT